LSRRLRARLSSVSPKEDAGGICSGAPDLMQMSQPVAQRLILLEHQDQ
jgi:hypothetical protein